MEGAHRSDVEIKSKSATEYTLQYKPHEPGVYLLNVKFADDHVAGRAGPNTQSTRVRVSSSFVKSWSFIFELEYSKINT